ncbi:aminotransferase class III-fold pyridoxal phosphate-dependent enzyme [Bradyrhizobium sp.]|uniref:aminotransferase class III-fold pyridoxal phosphate-dependent enzyme n=1 Tax=Bradyrhizobium sp. TaxID=376 RepID=UPI0039E6FA8A
MAQSLAELDKNHLIHPLISWSRHESRGPTILTSASGVHVTDSDGNTFIDGFSGLWCVNAGYGQQSIVDAVTEQMKHLAYATGYYHYSSEPTIRLAAQLAKLAPGNLNRVFFTLGGSDAIDSAIRLIRYYFNVTGRTKKKHMIALEKGFHGSSTMGSGLTALSPFHVDFDAPTPLQHHIPSHYAYRNPAGETAEAIIASSVASLKAKVQELGAENVAAFFAEPVQGAGGVIVPPDGWLKAMRDAARDLGILFVADEVITGFGRTGTMFGCEYDGVVPDLMTVAKGLTSGYLPMGALLMSEEIYRAIADNVPDGRPVGHGFTYSGHPASAAAGLAALRLYTEGGLLENGRKAADRFIARLNGLKDHPLVGDVRARGMLAGVELVTDKVNRTKPDGELKLGDHLVRLGFENRVIYRTFPDGVVGFAPPLSCTEDDVDVIADRFTKVLDGLLLINEVRAALA